MYVLVFLMYLFIFHVATVGLDVHHAVDYLEGNLTDGVAKMILFIRS